MRLCVPCDVCHLIFKTKRALDKHLFLTHGVRVKNANSCQVCGQVCFSVAELIVHQSMHNGIRNYACDLCECKFKLKGNLNRHIKNVHRIGLCKMFSCSLCQYSSPIKQDLQRHIEKMHNNPNGSRRKREDVVKYLLENNRIPYNREFCLKFVLNSNKYARIDFLITKETHLVCLECDEDSHRRNNKSFEIYRLMNVILRLLSLFNYTKIHIIRYNPDKIRNQLSVPQERPAILLNILDHVPSKLIEVSFIGYPAGFNSDYPECLQDKIVQIC